MGNCCSVPEEYAPPKYKSASDILDEELQNAFNEHDRWVAIALGAVKQYHNSNKDARDLALSRIRSRLLHYYNPKSIGSGNRLSESNVNTLKTWLKNFNPVFFDYVMRTPDMEKVANLLRRAVMRP